MCNFDGLPPGFNDHIRGSLTNTTWFHSYVESKKQNKERRKKRYKKKRKERLLNIENKPVAARGEMGELGEGDLE